MNYPRLQAFFPRPVLSILSSIFNASRAVDQAMTTPRHLTKVVKTISVGNIATGGNGKTPLVEYLARECIKRKQTPMILSRGYGNDERHQYQWNVPGCLVGIGPNRIAAGNDVLQKFEANISERSANPNVVAILDDGFQTWHAGRDIDIVCINCLNPFSNGEILPLGKLREPVSALGRATHVAMYNSQLMPIDNLASLVETVKQHVAKETPIMYMVMQPSRLLRLKQEYRQNGYEKLRVAHHGLVASDSLVGATSVTIPLLGKELLFEDVGLDVLSQSDCNLSTFSGIANPVGFHKTLHTLLSRSTDTTSCSTSILHQAFPDHHEFRMEDVHMIKQSGCSRDDDTNMVITTQKDICRVLHNSNFELVQSIFDLLDPHILVSDVVVMDHVKSQHYKGNEVWLDDIFG